MEHEMDAWSHRNYREMENPQFSQFSRRSSRSEDSRESSLLQKDRDIKVLKTHLADRDSQLQHSIRITEVLKAQLADRDTQLQDSVSCTEALKAQFTDKVSQLQNSTEACIETWKAQLADRDNQLQHSIQNSDALKAQLADKDSLLQYSVQNSEALKAQLADRDSQLQQHVYEGVCKVLREHEPIRAIKSLVEAKLAEKGAEILDLTAQIEKMHSQEGKLAEQWEDTLETMEFRIIALTTKLAEKGTEILDLKAQIEKMQSQEGKLAEEWEDILETMEVRIIALTTKVSEEQDLFRGAHDEVLQLQCNDRYKDRTIDALRAELAEIKSRQLPFDAPASEQPDFEVRVPQLQSRGTQVNDADVTSVLGTDTDYAVPGTVKVPAQSSFCQERIIPKEDKPADPTNAGTDFS